MTTASAHERRYAHGYHSTLQVMFHRRTAQTQAAFFLPHLRTGMEVLDCGCGAGTITCGLAAIVQPGQVIGVDIAESEIATARTKAGTLLLDNLTFERGDLYDLAFANGTFDAVFSHNVLEHLDDPLAALREMLRVLKPGGVIGIRDCDTGGMLIYPMNEQIAEWFALYEADWCAVAGDARFGRRLPGLMRTFPLQPVHVSASYDVYSDRSDVQLIGEIGANRCREQDFVQRVTAGGQASPAQLAQMRQAWLHWITDPDAFAAIAHTEVVGWKE